MSNTTCAERVQEAFEDRMGDIRTLYNAENQETEDLGSLNEYGLAIDTVEADTFEDQPKAYRRYQLSWGGPSEEFRVYDDRVEFWFLDWFDGAHVEVVGNDAFIIRNIVSYAD